MTDTQNHFEGWAVVELFGHGKAIGFVTTEYFGTACLFRVDTPERAEREYVLEKPTYGQDPATMREIFMPVGTKVKRQAMPAHSRLLGPSSIFALNPTGEALAMAQIERDEPRPLICLELPADYKPRQLTPAVIDADDEDDYQDDDLAEVG